MTPRAMARATDCKMQNLVMSDMRRVRVGIQSWRSKSRNVDTLFLAQHNVEVNYYGEELNLYSTHGPMFDLSHGRNNEMMAIPTVRNHSCKKDLFCNVMEYRILYITETM